MPTKTPALLTPEARAALLQIPPDLSDRDLARYYTLTPADQAVIARHRLPYNRLGFAVQLCMLRFPGRPLTDLLPLPARVLHYIAAQVAVDPAAFAAYGARENTLYRHLDEIRRTFGYNACRPRMSKRVTRGKVPRFVVELLGNYWCKKCRLACGNRHVTEFGRSTDCGSCLSIQILRYVGAEKYRNSGFSALFTAPSTLATRTFAKTHAINNYRYSYFAPDGNSAKLTLLCLRVRQASAAIQLSALT